MPAVTRSSSAPNAIPAHLRCAACGTYRRAEGGRYCSACPVKGGVKKAKDYKNSSRLHAVALPRSSLPMRKTRAYLGKLDLRREMDGRLFETMLYESYTGRGKRGITADAAMSFLEAVPSRCWRLESILGPHVVDRWNITRDGGVMYCLAEKRQDVPYTQADRLEQLDPRTPPHTRIASKGWHSMYGI